MQKVITIGSQFRYGRPHGGSGCYFSRDLPTATKIVLANHYIKKISGFAINEKIKVEYSQGQIIISKLTY